MQHAGLDRGAQGHDLVGVDALVRFLAEEIGDFLDDLGHPGHAADQDDLVDLALGDAGILQRIGDRFHRSLDQIADQRFQLGPAQLHDHVQRRAAVLVHADEGLVDLGLAGAGQLDLGFLGGLLQPLKGHLVPGQIDAVLFLEFVGEVVDDAHVEIFAAQERVPVGRFHLEQAVVDFQDGDVEGAAAEVIDRDRLAFLLVQTVGQRGRGRFVDNAQDFQARDLAGVLGGLTLGVVEIGRNRDDGLRDLFAQIGFGGLLHLLKDHRADLRRGIFLALHLDPGVTIAAIHDGIGNQLLVLLDGLIADPTADQTLDRENGVGGVGHGLALGGLADKPLAIGKADDRGRGTRAFAVLDDLGLAAIHDGDAAVGRAKVDADNFGHVFLTSLAAISVSLGSVMAPAARSRFVAATGRSRVLRGCI